jgi:hypothetical protein
VMSTSTLSGGRMLLWSAALLLVGGPLLGLLFGSVGMAALAFGFGAVHLGLGQLWASGNRGGRLIGIALMLGGASTVVDAAIWMLSSAGF